MAKIGIIGGSGLDDPGILKDAEELSVDTPYGTAAASNTYTRPSQESCALQTVVTLGRRPSQPKSARSMHIEFAAHQPFGELFRASTDSVHPAAEAVPARRKSLGLSC